MKRAIAWGTLVFALTVLAQLPAAFIARQINWPSGWQPNGVSGSLRHGRASEVGALAPVQWAVRPWAREVEVNLGFQQRIWALSIHGWPWNWQAQLAPRAVSTVAPPMFVLDGAWDGHLQVNGVGGNCRTAAGALVGDDLALLSPWSLNLGSTRLELQCSGGLRLLADVQLPAQHRFKIEADLRGQRVQIDGQVEAGAAVTPLLVQARWLQASQQTFSKVLGRRH